MKTTLLLLFISSTALAASPSHGEEKHQCYQKVITVCPTKKPRPKPKPNPEPVVVVKEVEVVREVEVVKTVEVVREVPAAQPPESSESDFKFTLHGAVGVGVKDAGDDWASASGMVGLRFQHKPSRLGAEAYSSLDRGVGLDVMFWTLQGQRLSHHIHLGVHFSGANFNKFSVDDVPRSFDLTAGTGIEIPVTKKLDITVDWKMRIPNPIFILKNDSPKLDVDGNQLFGPGGKYLDGWNVLGNSLAQSQVFVGVLYRL